MMKRSLKRFTNRVLLCRMQSPGVNGSHWRRWMAMLVLFLVCIVFYIMLSNMSLPNHLKFSESKWSPYKFQKFRDKEWFHLTCIGPINLDKFEDLEAVIEEWRKSSKEECREFYLIFIKLLKITFKEGDIVISKQFSNKVRKWLGNNEKLFQEAKTQIIISAFNKYTKENNVYNPIRSKRPVSIPDMPERQYIDQLAAKTQPSCDFCRYEENTAQDVFERIDNKLSYSASNTFKLDRWHALFMLKTHHPLNWTRDQFLDLMDTGQQWYKIVNTREHLYKYPSAIWDLLPHAGASQVHPHVHGFLDQESYLGVMELWRQAAEEYNHDFPNHNYFTDIIHIHSILGLTVTYGNAIAFANLVPKKDNEIVIVSEKADQDFFLLWYFVLRGFLDDSGAGSLCFSSAAAFPSMTGDVSSKSLPAYVRIVTRGAVADIRSDISSLELFAASNANTDPYQVIEVMQKSVAKRSPMGR